MNRKIHTSQQEVPHQEVAIKRIIALLELTESKIASGLSEEGKTLFHDAARMVQEVLGKGFLDKTCSDTILEEIETLIGPIQILIISEKSGEVITQYGMDEVEAEVLRKSESNDIAFQMTIKIFDKPRKYTIAVEHRDGTRIGENQLESIIKPMIGHYIERKEQECFMEAYTSIEQLNIHEKVMEIPPEKSDYTSFIKKSLQRHIRLLGFHETGDENIHTNILTRAIDICRSIVLGSENIPQEIDNILGGKIERDVLGMVKTLLLTRNETMNGFGYPSGLGKKDIPWEGRIYSIIRSYEIISSHHERREAIESMTKLAQIGYLDAEMLRVFFDCMDTGGGFPKIPKSPDTISPVSEYRRDGYYIPFIQLCSELIEKMEQIREIYQKGRGRGADTKVPNDLFKKSDILHAELLQIADMIITVIFSRHGEALSDIGGGSPGHPDEPLVEAGEESSYEKGIFLRKEPLKIIASPFTRRTQYTAAIVCHVVNGCIGETRSIKKMDKTHTLPSCTSCPAVTLEDALGNPRKDQENYRGSGFLFRLITDGGKLTEFAMRLLSSPKEITNLIITHGDVVVALKMLLENASIQDMISGEKILVRNNILYEGTLRGGRMLSPEEEKTRGLLFSIMNRDGVTSEVNDITQEVFGEHLYDPLERIGLNSLHNRLLDFINWKYEQEPDYLEVFIEQLEKNPITQYMIPILRTAGVIS